MAEAERTVRRKADHIRICLTKDVKHRSITAGFEDVHLIHNALPEIRFEDIDPSTELFGHKLSHPITIAGMTGGIGEALKINVSLAEAAEELGLGMGVGSQRVAIEDPKQISSFRIVREKAPKAFLIANIGCAQLVEDYDVNDVVKAVEMIDANALAIHLNPLHEAVQIEGQRDFRGALKKIGEISQTLKIPIIAKETGSGISAEVAKKLEEAGVDGIDVGGAGGVSWAAVEHHRAREAGNKLKQKIGLTFWDWGIPTVISLIEVTSSTKLATIATGGVRTGIDITKAVALGARCVGIASPLLKPAVKGTEKVVEKLNNIIAELKTAMFLSGAKSTADLNKIPLVVTGRTAEWLRARGLEPETYARRGMEEKADF